VQLAFGWDMATEKQYQFYKLLFDEENLREKQLREQARNYLSLATLYSAFVIFVTDKALSNMTLSMKLLVIAAIMSMGAAFILSLLVLQVANYEAITEPDDVTEQFGETPMKDEQFFDNRIGDFTVACNRNTKVNDKKAIYLEFAGYALVLGILLHAGFFVLRFV
jgi:hypothetical protein